MRRSTPEIEGSYEAAKWLKIPVLADASELESLFQRLNCFELHLLGTPMKREDLLISREFFLKNAQEWVEKLKRREAPQMKDFRNILASAMTIDSDSLWLHELSDGRFITKIKQPVIQIQAHFFSFAKEEKTFHSMVFGKESVFWGIQFSYPQIFMDPESGEPKKVDDSFANTKLFQEIRKWARDETRATPFLFNQEKINVPIRLGKNCFSWISNHPGLLPLHLEVAGAR